MNNSYATPIPNMYPTLPPLPVPPPVDPYQEQRAAYLSAVENGTKAVTAAAKELFQEYLTHIEEGNGVSYDVTPNREEGVGFVSALMQQFKTLVENVDPKLEVVINCLSCEVKPRSVAQVVPQKEQEPKREQTPAEKAFSLSENVTLGFLNEKLRSLRGGDSVWLHKANEEFYLCKVEKIEHNKNFGGTVYLKVNGESKPYTWIQGYTSFPPRGGASSVVFYPSWGDHQESRRLLSAACPSFKLVDETVTVTAVSNELEVGDVVLAKDSLDKWCLAKVTHVSPSAVNLQIKVHYLGWSERWDGWVNASKVRLVKKNSAPSTTSVSFVAANTHQETYQYLSALGMYLGDFGYDKIAAHFHRFKHFVTLLWDGTKTATLGDSKFIHKEPVVLAVFSFGKYVATVLCDPEAKKDFNMSVEVC